MNPTPNLDTFPPTPAFLWRGRMEDVAYDGDTLTVVLDTGFGCRAIKSLRLAGCNAPEVVGEEKEFGLRVRQFVREWLLDAEEMNGKWPLIVQTLATAEECRGDALYGRWSAVVWRKDGQCLNKQIKTLTDSYRRAYGKPFKYDQSSGLVSDSTDSQAPVE